MNNCGIGYFSIYINSLLTIKYKHIHMYLTVVFDCNKYYQKEHIFIHSCSLRQIVPYMLRKFLIKHMGFVADMRQYSLLIGSAFHFCHAFFLIGFDIGQNLLYWFLHSKIGFSLQTSLPVPSKDCYKLP